MSNEIMTEGLNWYVVRVINSREKSIKLKIESEVERLGLMDRLPQIYLPMEKIYTVKDGKKLMREKALFSGYIIIQSDLSGELKHTLKAIKGVTGFVVDRKGEPVPMSKTEVNKLLGQIEDNLVEKTEEPLIHGENVVIKDGPFCDFKGTVDEIQKNGKIKVNVVIFGRPTMIDLNANQIERYIGV